MSEITFRYNRAPTGELSGASMVGQTEQALSEVSRESSQAETDAAEALRIAQIAGTQAGEALTAATTAQETATAAGTAAATAQATANNAVTAANTAQAAAQGAAQTATAAAQSASAAQTAAQSAATAAALSEAKADQAVQTAGQAVTTAGQAVTTADNAVTRAAQAETNVGNAVTAAQTAAQNAQDSATAASRLANPNRYSAKTTSLTLSAGQIVDISDLDNANVAVGNKIIDAVGNIFQIASIDETAQTVTLVAANPDATPPTTGFWENPNRQPVGSYIYFAGSTVPDHYLLCNGAAVSRSDYADLYAVIGDTYGAGDGSTTFNLPNLIDKFLEGSATAGTEKAAGLPNITGKFLVDPNVGSACHIRDYSGAFSALGSDEIHTFTPSTTITNTLGVDYSANRSSAIYGNSSTVQPPALTALPCIRYE